MRKTYSIDRGSATDEYKAGQIYRTFTSNDGKVVTMNTTLGKIADDYPKDMPIYPNASSSLTQSSPEENVLTIAFQTSDSADKIARFYKKELKLNGWKIERATTKGKVTTLTALKENREATVAIINAGGARSIAQVLLHR